MPIPLSIHLTRLAQACPKITWYLAVTMRFVFLLLLMFAIADTCVSTPVWSGRLKMV